MLKPTHEEPGAAAAREVADAFAQTPPAYLEELLKQRGPGRGSVGSVFQERLTPEQVSGAEWSRYPHPNVPVPFRAYRAAIPGEVGVIALSELYPKSYVRCADLRKTGMIEPIAIIRRHKRPKVDFTTLIVGPKSDGTGSRVWDVYPGEPNTFPPRQRPALDRHILTVTEARKMGFEWANVHV